MFPSDFTYCNFILCLPYCSEVKLNNIMRSLVGTKSDQFMFQRQKYDIPRLIIKKYWPYEFDRASVFHMFWFEKTTRTAPLKFMLSNVIDELTFHTPNKMVTVCCLWKGHNSWSLCKRCTVYKTFLFALLFFFLLSIQGLFVGFSLYNSLRFWLYYMRYLYVILWFSSIEMHRTLIPLNLWV